MKALTLEKDYSIKLSSKVVDYIYPDYIFIPMYEGYKLKVKNNELVKKEQVLLEGALNIYSPISGRVVGAKECLLGNNKKQKCIVIENDFKEKMFSRTTMRKNIKQLSKKDFLDILENKKIINAEEPTSLLLELFKNKEINKIVLNAIEDEPYIATKIFLMQNYTDEVLEALSFLAKIFSTNDNVIVLSNNDRDNIEKYSNTLGTYPEVSLKLVPYVYPIGKDTILNEYLKFDDNNTLCISPANLLDIYYIIRKNKIVTEKYITITGNAIENPIVINSKIGAPLKKIVDEHIRYLNNEEVIYNINGLMRGFECEIDDLIVTSDIEGLIINYKKEYKEYNCINCGKCYEVCPVHIDPKLCFVKQKNDSDITKCISCGLCTYICPAYINFKDRIKEILEND